MDDKELDKMVNDLEPETLENDGSVENVEEQEEKVTAKPAQALVKEDSNNGRKYVLIAVIVLVMAGLSGFGAWAFLDGQSAKNQVGTLKQGLDAARADAAKLRADAAKKADTPTSTTTVVTKDEDAVVAAAIAYNKAPKSATNSKVTATVSKLVPPFAQVAVGFEEGSGAACVLKKVDDIWLVLFCGQDAPLQSTMDEYGVPASIIAS